MKGTMSRAIVILGVILVASKAWALMLPGGENNLPVIGVGPINPPLFTLNQTSGLQVQDFKEQLAEAIVNFEQITNKNDAIKEAIRALIREHTSVEAIITRNGRVDAINNAINDAAIAWFNSVKGDKTVNTNNLDEKIAALGEGDKTALINYIKDTDSVKNQINPIVDDLANTKITPRPNTRDQQALAALANLPAVKAQVKAQYRQNIAD